MKQFRGRTKDDYETTNFFSADDDLRDRLFEDRNTDPCGYPGSTGARTTGGSALSTGMSNQANRGRIEVPILLTYGLEDADFEHPMAGEMQRDGFSGSDDVTLEFLEDTGHALQFEKSAPEYRQIVHEFLEKRGF